MKKQASHHEGHGVKPGQAAPHVLFPRGDHKPRPRRHAPLKLLEPLQEEDDAPARDEDDRQRDDPDT